MKFNKLTPILMVEDVSKTIDYYLDIIGFEYVMGVEPGSQQPSMSYSRGTELSFAIMKRDGVELMFQSKSSMAEELPVFGGMKVGGSFGSYIEIDGVEEYYSALKGKVDQVSGLETKFYGMREFTIRDCNGYCFTFAERS